MKTYTEKEIRAMTRNERRNLRNKGVDIPKLPPGAPKGYQQTQEHIEKRKRWGCDHHAWLGDDATQKTGRSRAARMYLNIGNCVLCDSTKSERHHIDGDTLNNNPENVIALCRRCHMKEDGRLEKLKELAIANQPKAVATRWG
jgi:hypothetical protein